MNLYESLYKNLDINLTIEVGKIKNSKSKVVLICPIHGVFMQEVGNHLRSAHGCTECGKEARGKSNRDTKDS